MGAPAEVVCLLVQNHRSAEDVVGAGESDLRVDEVELAVPLVVEQRVAEVADVAVYVVRVAVIMLEKNVRVKVRKTLRPLD